jgi:hypothetical protein
MAVADLQKAASRIKGRIMDGWVDLDGKPIQDEIVGVKDTDSDGNYEEVLLANDKTVQIDTASDLSVDTTGDGTLDTSVGISGATYDSANGQTVVTLSSAIPSDPTGNLAEYTGSTYQSLGHLQDITISYDPVNKDAGVAGREKQIAIDAEVTLVLEQTGDEEFAALSDMLNLEGLGLTFKATEEKVLRSNVDTANGFKFNNAFPSISGEFDGSGEGSSFTISFGGRIKAGDFGKTFTFGA